MNFSLIEYQYQLLAWWRSIYDINEEGTKKELVKMLEAQVQLKQVKSIFICLGFIRSDY